MMLANGIQNHQISATTLSGVYNFLCHKSKTDLFKLNVFASNSPKNKNSIGDTKIFHYVLYLQRGKHSLLSIFSLTILFMFKYIFEKSVKNVEYILCEK